LDSAESHHLDTVCELENELKIVTDDHNGNSPGSERGDYCAYLRRFPDSERCRRLIEKQDGIVLQDCSGDGDTLSLAAGQVPDGYPDRRKPNAKALKGVGCAGPHCALSKEHTSSSDRLTEIHVCSYVQRFHEREILEDYRQTEAPHDAWIDSIYRRVVDLELASVEAIHAHQGFHEGGLPRAVVSNDGEHLARVYVEVNRPQGRDVTEQLPGGPQTQHR
jgi:hypothetical protein